MNRDCIFCRIIEGSADRSLVCEDAHAVAFMDLGQINPGHVLIVPRRHAAELVDLSEEEAAATFGMVHRVACAVKRSGLRCEGYNVWQSNGTVAGQDVFHVHFHVLPRFPGDALRISVAPDRPMHGRADLDAFAGAIAAQLD
ncbi:MAG: HIT domain-containing protein [Candidatus Hydrogenedentes bacterium]|nr:HIT domain-containing protein [Candidatus Hydrogenedentota bacterium]